MSKVPGSGHPRPAYLYSLFGLMTQHKPFSAQACLSSVSVHCHQEQNKIFAFFHFEQVTIYWGLTMCQELALWSHMIFPGNVWGSSIVYVMKWGLPEINLLNFAH